MRMKKITIILAVFALFAVFAPSLAFADIEQAMFQPIVPLPGVTSEMTFGEYINQLFTLVVSLSAILAVLVIIYGGFEYMTSSAGISKKNGMERIQGAVTGLLLLLSVTLILRIINPCLLDITVLSIEGSEPTTSECSSSSTTTAPPSTTPTTAPSSTSYQPPTGSCTSLQQTQCVNGVTPRTKCLTNGVYSDPPATGGCPGGGGLKYICEGVSCGAPPPSATAVQRSSLQNLVACSTTGSNLFCCNTTMCEPSEGPTCSGTMSQALCTPSAAPAPTISLLQLLNSRGGTEGACTVAAGSGMQSGVACCNSARTDCSFRVVSCPAARPVSINVCINNATDV